MESQGLRVSVGEFIVLMNQTLEYAYPSVEDVYKRQRYTLQTTVDAIRSKVDMSIYVRTDTKDGDIKSINNGLQDLSTVKSVSFVSPEEAREDFAKKHSDDSGALSALKEATNKFPGTFRVNLQDINNTDVYKRQV